MEYLGVSDLRDYSKWAGRSAEEIKKAVKMLPHGWATVFGTDDVKIGIPQWANRVRNFFNETPTELAPINIKDSHITNLRLPKPGILNKFAMAGGTNVYKDRSGNFWFSLVATSAVYHEGDGHPSKQETLAAVKWRQADHVFKLLAPDGTGGSSELILSNPRKLSHLPAIFPEGYLKDGKWFSVTNCIVFDHVLRGSYNFADALVMGGKSHEYLDIAPHMAMKKEYVNPPPFSPLSSRIFPSKLP
ncbi:MAG: hypothetical protein DWQ47_14350 [Acidobacteria bacterium]|nr:MAG: hypothetical protein DWQ32_01750 [Acidobacteriota bacterium]REK02750.1 MAG: hypothetical protein DWQ38_10385 [Acidobacteriota bacterium]REK13445.1 MAG: hypothetical protein DWQ43_07440 [Acidobacteriota bacterium]REK41439.1 MAG: hypothetical protein DWQ47_14350 [Acidobacteriota bacterium]